eukprot:5381933-Pleurochrysis_carterae.AAC.1
MDKAFMAGICIVRHCNVFVFISFSIAYHTLTHAIARQRSVGGRLSPYRPPHRSAAGERTRLRDGLGSIAERQEAEDMHQDARRDDDGGRCDEDWEAPSQKKTAAELAVLMTQP